MEKTKQPKKSTKNKKVADIVATPVVEKPVVVKEKTITEKLQELKKVIPYRWRIQSINKDTGRATCVAYIDARDVMEILDDTLGAENWKDEYRVIEAPSDIDEKTKDGTTRKETNRKQLVCTLSIKINGEWVGKEDTGKPSETEEEKGWFSDTFKRAAVKWGVGRFLYEEDVKYINTKNKAPVDDKGNRIWDLTKYFNDQIKGAASKQEGKAPITPTAPNQSSVDNLTKLQPAINSLTNAKTVPEIEKIVQDLIASRKYTGLEMNKIQTFVKRRKEEVIKRSK